MTALPSTRRVDVIEGPSFAQRISGSAAPGGVDRQHRGHKARRQNATTGRLNGAFRRQVQLSAGISLGLSIGDGHVSYLRFVLEHLTAGCVGDAEL